MLCRCLNIKKSDVGEELVMSFNSAMQMGGPNNYEKAVQSPEKSNWIKAMEDEMNSIKQAEKWVVKEPDTQVKPVKCKWVFTKKCNNQGQVVRYNARLVAKGYTQKYGLDYHETFAPVAKFKSVRLLAALCAKLNLLAYQDYIPTAFLRGNLKETICMI